MYSPFNMPMPERPQDANKEQVIEKLVQKLQEKKEREKEAVMNSYAEKMNSKKKEITKLLQFSLVFLLALSVHHFAEAYLNSLIIFYDMSFNHQLMIKAAYVGVIILLILNFKVFIR